jgi:hypothetical protein
MLFRSTDLGWELLKFQIKHQKYSLKFTLELVSLHLILIPQFFRLIMEHILILVVLDRKNLSKYCRFFALEFKIQITLMHYCL